MDNHHPVGYSIIKHYQGNGATLDFVQRWLFSFPDGFARKGEAMSKPILIIEDNEPVRAIVAATLRAHGYETVIAGDGREAMTRLEAGLEPDLILLDMILPDVDGWQFCARYLDGHDHVPVVILTGLGIASEEWARSMGAVALLRKPVETAELIATIRRYVEGTRRI
jgi:CheY-like chemotaxis protein